MKKHWGKLKKKKKKWLKKLKAKLKKKKAKKQIKIWTTPFQASKHLKISMPPGETPQFTDDIHNKLVANVEKAETPEETEKGGELDWDKKVQDALANGILRIMDTAKFMEEYGENVGQYAKNKYEGFKTKVAEINTELETQLKNKQRYTENLVSGIIDQITQASTIGDQDMKRVLAGEIDMKKAKSLAEKKNLFENANLEEGDKLKLDMAIAIGEGKFNEWVSSNRASVRGLMSIPPSIPTAEGQEAISVAITFKNILSALGVKEGDVANTVKKGLTIANLFTNQEMARIVSIKTKESNNKDKVVDSFSTGISRRGEKVPERGVYAQNQQISLAEGVEIVFTGKEENDRSQVLAPTTELLQQELSASVEEIGKRLRVIMKPLPIENTPQLEEFNRDYVQYQFHTLDNKPTQYGVVISKKNSNSFAIIQVEGEGANTRTVSTSARIGDFAKMNNHPMYQEAVRTCATKVTKVEEADKIAAETNTYTKALEVLREIAAFDTVAGSKVINKIAEEFPMAVLSRAIDFNLRTYKTGREAIETAANKEPNGVLVNAGEFVKHPWGKAAIIEAAKSVYANHPESHGFLLRNIGAIVDSDSAGRDIITSIVEDNPELVIDERETILANNGTFGEILVKKATDLLRQKYPERLNEERRRIIADTPKKPKEEKKPAEPAPVAETGAEGAEVSGAPEQVAEPKGPDMELQEIGSIKIPKALVPKKDLLTNKLKDTKYPENTKVEVNIKGDDDFKWCSITVNGREFSSEQNWDKASGELSQKKLEELFVSTIAQIEPVKTAEESKQKNLEYLAKRIVLPGTLGGQGNRSLLAKRMLEVGYDKTTKVSAKAIRSNVGYEVEISINDKSFSANSSFLQPAFLSVLTQIEGPKMGETAAAPIPAETEPAEPKDAGIQAPDEPKGEGEVGEKVSPTVAASAEAVEANEAATKNLETVVAYFFEDFAKEQVAKLEATINDNNQAFIGETIKGGLRTKISEGKQESRKARDEINGFLAQGRKYAAEGKFKEAREEYAKAKKVIDDIFEKQNKEAEDSADKIAMTAESTKEAIKDGMEESKKQKVKIDEAFGKQGEELAKLEAAPAPTPTLESASNPPVKTLPAENPQAQNEYMTNGVLTAKGEKALAIMNLEDKSVGNRALTRTRATNFRIRFKLTTDLSKKITHEDFRKVLES